MNLQPTRIIDVKQVATRLSQGLLALAFVAGLGSCGGPSTPAETTTEPATLPATPAARDSVKAALTTPAADAAGTSAPDTAAAKQPAAKPLDKPKSALPRASVQPLAVAPATAEVAPAPEPAPLAAPAAAPVAATTRTQAGRVLDEDGRPLAGATVMLKGGSKVTSTDANGNYSLEVAGGDDTFVFGYGGYADEVATTHDGQPLNVSLLPDPNSKVRGRKRR